MSKFIDLAVSKDDSRPNLQAPYRTRSWIVATDGNRMHAITGLPEISDADSHWTTGQDLGQYPTVSMFLDHVPPARVAICLNRATISRLKVFQGLLKAHKSSDVCCELECTEAGVLTLKYAQKTADLVTSIALTIDTDKLSDFPDFHLWINGQFLLDALLNMATGAFNPMVKLCPNGKTVGAFYLECEYSKELAVIMPMKCPV
jgi:hypothetical protein